MRVDGKQTSLFVGHGIRLPAVADHDGLDFFDRVRRGAVAILLASGAAIVIGGVLDWASLERCPEIVEGSTFDESELEDPPPCPLRGIDATEGKVAVVSGFVMLFGAIMLTLRERSGYAWLAFVSAIVAGSVAIAAYRGIGDVNSSISRRFGLIDAYEVTLGLNLVAAAAIVGMIASIAAITATPQTR
jgi:hypothetical protein